ncbi:MAG TPA: GreA/GreB family elongation factor, partial [Anaerolineae bacterium]|nr:GreA/GreB family elongation factor [Anaerolineae bacterium]
EVEEYRIVGAVEAEPSAGFISNKSPIGRALLGAKIGDIVAALTPAGETHFRVLAIG